MLIAFLFEWRTALISLLAIPLSLMAAVLVLYLRGDTINTMILAGLVIAVGVVVDDAIIDVENIWRRLRERGDADRQARAADHPRGLARGPQRDLVRDADQRARRRAGVLPAERDRVVLRAAGVLLRAGDPRLDGGRADGHAGAGLILLSSTPRQRGDAPLVRWLKRGYGALLAARSAAAAGLRRGRACSPSPGVVGGAGARARTSTRRSRSATS